MRNPRLDDLLVERALQGLDDGQTAELRALGGEEDDSFDLAAAAVELAYARAKGGEEALPAALAAKILASAPVATGTAAERGGPQGARRVASLPPPRRAAGWVPWAAAAAFAALAMGAWGWAIRTPPAVVRVEIPVSSLPPPSAAPTPQPKTASDRRLELLAEVKDARRVEWARTKDPAARAATGDVVWSPSAQQGYMRFVGLHPNDSTKTQYQLWIFDKDRDGKYPVDGGVFDVPSTGEVVVPVIAKLHVDAPTLFAVTVERPGGVVVSKRERIVLTAAVSSG